jgi:hypothetical protein
MNLSQHHTWFCQRPDDGGDPDDLIFRLSADWYALDGDKLILPITPLEKSGNDLSEMGAGLLTQYGGSELLLGMASSDQELEQGTEWILSYRDDLGFRITPASI